MLVIVIGREQDCNVILSDVKISRHHAQLVNDGGRVTICDLNSKNGTFVNGVRIDAPRVLNPGDQVALGGVPIPWEHYLSSLQSSNQMPMNQMPMNQPPINQFPLNQVPIQNDFGETNSVKQQKELKLLPLWISLAAVLLMALVFFGIRMMRNNRNKNRIENQVIDSLQEKRNEEILLNIVDELDEKIKEKQATLNSLAEDMEKAQKEAEAAKKDADAAKRAADLEKSKADKAKADADNAKKAADLEKKKADKAKKDADDAKKEAERVTSEDVDISALYFAIDQLSSEQLKNACDELGCSNKEGLVNKFKSSSEAGRARIFSVLQKWTE